MSRPVKTILASSLLSFVGVASLTFGQSSGTINQLQHFRFDGTNITQSVSGRPIKITGLSDGCLSLSSSIITSTGVACGSGGGGAGTDKWATSTNLLAIYPNAATAVVFGGSATTTTGALFENLGSMFVSGSTTLQNFTFQNATGTNATTTNLFSTTASSTRLFSAFGTLGNLLALGSTTLQNFTFLNATGSNATTTNLFATNASSTRADSANLSTGLFTARGLSTLANFTATNGTSTVLSTTKASTTNLWLSGAGYSTANCLQVGTDGLVSGTGSACGSAAGSPFPFTPTTNFGALTNSTSTPIWATAGLQASSTSYFTTLNAKSVGAIRYADQFGGSDIGAKVNAAYADLPSTGGTIVIPAGSYSFSTAMNFSTAQKPVQLECSPAATILTYTGTGTSTIFNAGGDTANFGYLGGYGMNGCTLNGPGPASKTAGVEVGGSNHSHGFVMTNNHVSGFGFGLALNSNTYLAKFVNNAFFYSTTLVGWMATTNAGEQIHYEGNTFDGGYAPSTCITSTSNNPYASVSFVANSFDDCGVNIAPGTLSATFTGNHWENPTTLSTSQAPYYYLSIATSTVTHVVINGGIMMNDATTTPNNLRAFIYNNAYLDINGLTVHGNGAAKTVPNLVIDDLQGDSFLNLRGINNQRVNGGAGPGRAFEHVYNGNNSGYLGVGLLDYFSSKFGSSLFGWNTNSNSTVDFYNGSSTIMTISSGGLFSFFNGASTSALRISGTGYSTTNCLQVDTTGLVSGTGSACGSGGAGFGNSWELTSALDAIRPTTTVGIIVSASSTFAGNVNITGNATATNATTTRLFSTTASSTNLFTSNLSISNLNGLLKGTNGAVSVATAGTDYVTPSGLSTLGLSKWATSTADAFAIYDNSALRVGVGTTTPQWALQVASSTGAQLTLSDGSNSSSHWSFRSAGGNLYLATSSPSSFATSSGYSALTILNGASGYGPGGDVGIGTSSPFSTLGIEATGDGPFLTVGSSTQTRFNVTGNSIVFGSSTAATTNGVTQFVSFQSNTRDDAYVTFRNYSSGKSISQVMQANSAFAHFDIQTTAGLWLLGNFGDAPFRIADDSGASTRYPFMLAQGAPTNSFNMNSVGNVGFGTATPRWAVTIASSTGPQLTLSDGTGQSNHWSFRSAGGNLYIATSSRTSFATTTSASTTLSLLSGGVAGLVGIASSTPGAVLAVEMRPVGPSFMVGHRGSTTPSIFIGGFNEAGGGFVGIATTTSPATSTPIALVVGSSNLPASRAVAVFGNASSGVCYVVPSTTGAFTCTSDARAKHNVTNLGSALDTLMALRPVAYNWNSEKDGDQLHAGFIAQEVQPLLPDLIQSDDSGMLSMNYAGLTPYLVSAVQALNEKVEALDPSTAKRSMEENWQNILIALLFLYVGYNEMTKRRR